MRRAFATAAAVVLSLGLAGGPATAAPQGTPSSATTKATSTQTSYNPDRTGPRGPQDVCNFSKFRPSLQRGSSGSAVRQAQCYLNEAIDADLRLTGFFGRDTRRATRAFQRCAGIVVDGRIGAQTWSFLSFWANAPGRPFC
jgi:peptidoglycan hydrolase-like protein with peptidoglycan-binding domain